jgi:hypothetical protein
VTRLLKSTGKIWKGLGKEKANKHGELPKVIH